MPYWEMPNTWGPEWNEMLAELTLEGRWDKVVQICLKFPEAHTATIKEYMGTALHVTIEFNKEVVVKQLVEAIIIEEHRKEIPSIIPEGLVKGTNEQGDTPLHVAASRGYARLCKLIVGPENQERARLVTVKNDEGETPLFQAALAGSKTAFAYLSHISRDFVKDVRDLVRNNGDSILHCAIKREFMDLAVIIVNRYPFLCTLANNDGFTPLKVLATKPSVFRSGCSISWWLLILYHFVFVEPLDVERTMEKFLKETDWRQRSFFPMKYETICEFFSTLGKLFGKNLKKDRQHDTEDPRTRLEGGFLPPNYATFPQVFKRAYVSALRLSGVDLGKTIEAKEKRTWSRQLLDALMKDPYGAYIGRGGKPVDADEIDPDIVSAFPYRVQGTQPDQATPLLLAARNGISEMVFEILDRLPSTLHEINTEKENVLLVAVLNRQPLIVEELKKKIKPEVWSNLILAEDKKENNMLHLAARAPDLEKHKQIAGLALQMMWDTKWYEYIGSIVPKHFNFRTNSDLKTAEDIFEESHEKLVKEGNTWLKETSTSCSVVATVVASVSFATSTTVPGGNGENGQSPLEGQPAFNVFAISSLAGFCFSVMALMMFLAIPTSRKEAKDFRTELPRKLFIGLSSLFVSIAATSVSFCSGHSFNINHKYKNIMLVLYAATSIYVLVQFPLYFDLLFTIFRKVPRIKGKW